MSAWPRRIRVFGVSIIAGWLSAATASAVVFNVDSFLDEVDDDLVNTTCHTDVGSAPAGKCTLRAAVMQANVMPSDSTINLPAGVYYLTRLPVGGNGPDSGDLNLASPTSGSPTIAIAGAGAAITIVDASQLDRVVKIEGLRTATIAGVTLRNGLAIGGGIFNLGTLTVESCTISGNSSPVGGGGIVNGGSLHLNRSTVRDNVANTGGGIYNSSFELWLDQCTVSENQANELGGGIHNFAASTICVSNTTISGNHANDDGGGVYNDTNSTVWTYNATIAFNHANVDADFDATSGGGVYNVAGAFFYPRNSVIAGNDTFGGTVDSDCVGTAGVFGFGWFGTLAGCFPSKGAVTAMWDEVGSLAELGPLQFNGASTRTHALQAGSTMIDSGFACNGTGDPSIDQRGGLRTPALTCDGGAFEYGALPAGLIFADGFALGNLWGWG